MNPHRVEVLDAADDDRVVLAVAHDLELELLPAGQVFFDQHGADRAQTEGILGDCEQLVFVHGAATARPAQGKAGPQDNRITNCVSL